MWDNIKEYLPIKDCRPDYLYKILARNGEVGIFTKDNSFILSRHKFGTNYTFPELHWDDTDRGTAKPVKELEKVPNEIINGSEDQKLEYLNKWELECQTMTKFAKLSWP